MKKLPVSKYLIMPVTDEELTKVFAIGQKK